jgi:uncharacterized membrane protein
MPYEWIPPPAPDAPARLHLWPHRSLSRGGFVGFIAVTSALIAVPLVGLVGSPVLWGLLPFLVAAVAAVWLALRRSYADAQVAEALTLAPARLHLVREGPRGRRQEWEANPHWVRVTLHETGGPVPNYLTLRGANREVEIGAFLSEEERVALRRELEARLAGLRG